jgi:hypothetical protein
MRALYLGEDDPLVGLYHGKHYEITKKVQTTGKIVVEIEDLLGLKKRYPDITRFRFDWIEKKEKRK